MAIIKRTQTKTQAVAVDERARARDFEGLVAELSDANPTARRWAARDLAAFREPSAALLDRLAQEPDASVREAILLSLTKIGDATAVAGLVNCLRSDDAFLRNEAIEALKQLPGAVAPIMNGLLTDPDPDVRIFAVNVLESLRHPDVEKWLIEVITRDPYVNVCATAVDLLGEVGSEAALAPLEALKTRFAPEPYIVFAADLAIKRIRED
jgi:HEAT repeat protein